MNLAAAPYSVAQAEKEARLVEDLNELTEHHRRRCAEYDRLLKIQHPGYRAARRLKDLPFLPVSLFKYHALRSVLEVEIFKTLTSSGTTGQRVSRIVLDRETARLQTLALASIMKHVLGSQRLPMILIESATLVRDRRQFSARAAGLLGMLNFGRDHFYALDSEMRLDKSGLRAFLEKFAGKEILIFGFTFMAWQYLLGVVGDREFDLSRAILIHSGGWKKLQELAVSIQEFRARFEERTGLQRIYNFYGMVEQVGSVFLEGEDGFLYAPHFADVIVRDPVTFEESPMGRPGLIQVLSAIPRSYPGHSLLTEDIGVIHGIDDSRCGRMGKRFSVLGRVAKAELRGCSDVHASTAA